MTQEKLQHLQEVRDRLKTDGCSAVKEHGPIFEHILEKVQPKNILEIGFFTGSSANMFLELSDANLTSVDPIDDNPTTDYLKSVGRPEEIGNPQVSLDAVESLKLEYKERFNFIRKRSLNALVDGDLKEKYDLIYIDGDHWYPGVVIDLTIALTLKIPYLILDDCNETYPGVLQAVNSMQNKFEVMNFYKNGHANILFLKNLFIK